MIRPISATVRAGADAFIRLAALTSSADGIQWERSHTPKPREDVDRKAAGGHGDPTGDIAMDPRRLELREAVEEASRVLEQNIAAALAAQKTLSDAIASWHGEDL